MAARPAHPALSEGLDPVAFARTLWRARAFVLACALLGLALGAVRAHLLVAPRYAASTVIVIDAPPAPVAEVESLIAATGIDAPALETELLVLRSRPVLGAAVDALGLDAHSAFGPGRERAIDRLSRASTASLIGRARAFRLSVTTGGPDLSARAANAIAAAYLEEGIARKARAHAAGAAFLSERAALLRERLERQEGDLATLREAAAATPETLAHQEGRLRARRARVAALEGDLAEARARAHLVASLISAGDLEALAAATGDPALIRALGTPRAGDAARALLGHAEGAAARIAGQLPALRASLPALSSGVAEGGASLIRLEQAEREARATRLLYESVLARLQEAGIGQGLGRADARVLSRAVPRPLPIAPRKSVSVLAGLLAGLAGGGALALGLGLMRRGFEDAAALREATGRRVVEIGADPVDAGTALRTGLAAGAPGAPRLVLMASCGPGDGAGAAAEGLVAASARIGRTALLIDLRMGAADTPTPGAWRDPAPGAGRIAPCAGEDAVAAADRLAGPEFGALLEEVRARWDLVVIAAPALPDAPHARILAPHAEACILAVRTGRTPREAVAEAARGLEEAGGRLWGFALGGGRGLVASAGRAGRPAEA